MAVYAIGDVQGCFAPLRSLLDQIGYNPDTDRLWFTGDLVNRGPQSLEVLRFVMAQPLAISVLGNHDLHLLAVASGQAPYKPSDSFRDVLEAPDREVLLAWLRRRPLLHHDAVLGYTLVHAGFLPPWDLPTARRLAAEAEESIRHSDRNELFTHMYGNAPDHWQDELSGWDRLRVILNAFTRLRYCDAHGHMNLQPKGPPGDTISGLLPWFQAPGRLSRRETIVIGHWSTLGVRDADGIVALDSGCVWGGKLTAVRLDTQTRVFVAVPCPQAQAPHRDGNSRTDRPT